MITTTLCTDAMRIRQDHDAISTKSLWQSILGIFLMSQLAIVMVSRQAVVVEIMYEGPANNAFRKNKGAGDTLVVENSTAISNPIWQEDTETPTFERMKGDVVVLTRDKAELHNMTNSNNITCTSPETHVPFSLERNIRIFDNNHHTCGLQAGNHFSKYMVKLRDTILPNIMDDDCSTIVFGVALGKSFIENIVNATMTNPDRSQRLLQQHGRCFFMFVSENDVEKPTLQGHMWLVPIPQSTLPYRNHRRNAKLLKYSGHLMFPNSSTIVWQDAKFFNKELRRMQPTHYNGLAKQQSNNCLTTFGLPVHPYTMGEYVAKKPSFQAHCDTIVTAMKHRPNVTDSVDSVLKQCELYTQQFATNNYLDHAMVDTAFMIWNEEREECRDFNNNLRCRLLKEIHCHSDRDQIPWPYVLNDMGLEGRYGDNRLPVNDHWNPKIQDVAMRYANNSNHTMVTILRSNCHWYKNAIGKGGCKYWDDVERS